MNIYYIVEDFVWEGSYKMRATDSAPIERKTVVFEKGDWLIQDGHHNMLYRVHPRKKTLHDVAHKAFKSSTNSFWWGYTPLIQELLNIRVARMVNGRYFSLKIIPHLKKETRPELARYFKYFPWLVDKSLLIPEHYK